MGVDWVPAGSDGVLAVEEIDVSMSVGDSGREVGRDLYGTRSSDLDTHCESKSRSDIKNTGDAESGNGEACRGESVNVVVV